ncbi:MAG: cytochrome P450 [Nitrospirae bacterium]|nr:cytochrome P450 [Candidatus Manganitrophaceae bacterium]
MSTKEYSFPPGPSGKPLVGHLFAFRRDPIRFLMRLAKEYGDAASFKIGSQEMVLLSHPESIKAVLTTDHRNFTKGRGLQWAKRLLGEGLLTSEGEFHRRQRRIAQPAFHRQRIASYGEIMTGYAARMREGWKAGTPFDLHAEMMHLTMGIAAKTLFDADVDSKAHEIGEALSTAVEFFNRFTLPFADLMAELPIPSTLRFKKAKQRLDETIYRMIAERRASDEDRGDLLSMLLHATDEEGTGGMTDLQLRDEAMTIFLAGHETTANALAWTWYLLSQHPEVEAKLHAEIDLLLGDRLPTVDDLPKLQYVEKVLAESMRLYPPAWLVGYRAIDDYSFEKYNVPGGTIFLMSQYVVHHDSRYFPDPFRFDPERWTPEAKAARPKFSYFPFGGGPRVCIGETFAWMEAILVMAAIARRWQLRLVPGHPVVLQPLITLRPRYGMKMVATRRG